MGSVAGYVFFSSNFEWNHNGADQPAWMIFAFVVRLAKRPSVSRIIQIHVIIMNCFCVSCCPPAHRGEVEVEQVMFCFITTRLCNIPRFFTAEKMMTKCDIFIYMAFLQLQK